MGYSYGYTSSGRLALSCDNCGGVGGVRKRHCPHMVLGDSLRSTGQRTEMHYCYPPALCGPCLNKLGGMREVHKDCAEGAARSQAEYDAKQARLDAGEYMVISARGDWAEWVPKGKVGVHFQNVRGEIKVALVEGYDPSQKPLLSDYPEAIEIPDPERVPSKQQEVA